MGAVKRIGTNGKDKICQLQALKGVPWLMKEEYEALLKGALSGLGYILNFEKAQYSQRQTHSFSTKVIMIDHCVIMIVLLLVR